MMLSSSDDDLIARMSKFPSRFGTRVCITYLVVHVSHVHYKIDVKLEVVSHYSSNDIR